MCGPLSHSCSSIVGTICRWCSGKAVYTVLVGSWHLADIVMAERRAGRVAGAITTIFLVLGQDIQGQTVFTYLEEEGSGIDMVEC